MLQPIIAWGGVLNRRRRRLPQAISPKLGVSSFLVRLCVHRVLVVSFFSPLRPVVDRRLLSAHKKTAERLGGALGGRCCSIRSRRTSLGRRGD
jgi:hypothetical protein